MAFSLLLVMLSCLFSLVAGLLPGLHPNSIGAIGAGYFSNSEFWPFFLILLLGGRMALQFLPSIFLGVPDGETQVALLPGQRMLMDGQAHQAVLVCAFSVLAATLLSILLSPLILPFLPSLFAFVKPFTAPLLVFAALFSVAAERGIEKKLKSAIVFLFSALLGQLALNLPLADPLFPLFVGFFTLPMFLRPAPASGQCPAQQDSPSISLDILPLIALGILFGALADLLPGISTPAQIALFASLFVSIGEARHFLALVASIEASHAVFALTSSASVGVARVGVVAMAQQFMLINPAALPVLFGAFLLSVSLGALAAVRIGKLMARHWHEMNWHSLGLVLCAYLVLMVFLTGGILALMVLATACFVGLLPVLWSVRRTQVMGSLIGPSVAHALGF